jgi:Protein of unknown function (DUF3662)/FHA domain
MGVLDRFEKGIERAVNSAFAKAFRSEVQPVEVASALCRECDDRVAVVGRGRSLVPNSFVVELSESDFGRVGEWQDALADELQAVVSDHAAQQGYSFVGAVQVSFEHADDLDTGVFRVRSSMTRPPTHAGHAGLVPGAEIEATAADPAPSPVGAVPAAAQPTLDVDGQVYRLSAPVTVLGRSSEADIALDDPGISRRHAQIQLGAGHAVLLDLDSTNGTFVDGERVRSTPLSDGSQITMGRTRIVYRLGRW